MGDLIQVRSDDGRVYHIDEDNGVVKAKDGNGRLVNMAGLKYMERDLAPGDVHIPSALANYAAGYKLADGIADQVFPAVMTDKASDYFYTWDKNDALQPAMTLLAGEGDKIPEISPRLSSTQFTTAPYGIASFVPQGVIANADSPLQPRRSAINRCMNVMMISRETRAAAAVNATAFAGYTAAIAAANKWNGGATSDPVKDIHTAVETALQPVTHMVLSERTWHDFIRNPNTAKYAMYKDNQSNVNPQSLAALLDIPIPVIGRMKVRSASAGTYGYAWGDDVLFMHQPAGIPVDGQTICCGKTFRWNKGGLATDASGFRVRIWFDPNRGQDGGEMIAVLANEVITVTAAASSYLYTAVHA